jgi:hypothetical protein
MNQYLEEKLGVINEKEEIIRYKEIIEDIKRDLEKKESLIRECSIFNKSIINFIKERVDEFYNDDYRLEKLPMPNHSSSKKKKQKYKYVLISKSLSSTPEYNSDEYWYHLENENIIIIGTTRPIEDVKIIESVSFYDKDANRDDTLDFFRPPIIDENTIYFQIQQFMNIIILDRYKNNCKKISTSEIKELYQEYQKNVKVKKLIPHN